MKELLNKIITDIYKGYTDIEMRHTDPNGAYTGWVELDTDYIFKLSESDGSTFITKKYEFHKINLSGRTDFIGWTNPIALHSIIKNKK